MSRKPSNLNFDKISYPLRPDVDYRAHPDRYRVGRGGQGVLICRPYQGRGGWPVVLQDG
ncbi:DUF4385 family protein [Mesorhizobium sp. RCC_202]|uniref:DUF4385 family protein n=1 Tax=Mesorhizobium sp. RCC_202 TaxID=3239222 RepID=UPI0035238BDF